MLTAASNVQPFPNIPFSVFSKFVEDNFISTVSLSTVLMVLFTVTENTDLLSLRFHQRSADHPTENSTSATSWIRCFGTALRKRLAEDNVSLLKESDMDAMDQNKKQPLHLE
jgi:hypothetical protein